jgi:hypothetical protein
MASAKSLIKKPKKKVVKGAPRVKRGAKLTGPSFVDFDKLSGYEFHRLRQDAVQFYYQNYKSSDVVPFIYEWMKHEGYSRKDISSAKKGQISPTVAIYSKLLLTGCPDYYEPHNEYWESCPGTMNSMRPITEYLKPKVDEAVAAGSLLADEIKKEEKIKNIAPVLSIQQKLKNASMVYATKLEEEIDVALDDIQKFNVKEFNPVSSLRRLEVKGNHARIIREYFKPVAQEYNELIGPKKKDDDMYDQLVEGYSYLDTKSQKKIAQIYNAVVSACDMIITSQKATQTRTKKPVAKDKIVARLKYQKEDTGLKVASVNPVDILEATQLWVYNVKTRKLGTYVAEEHATLQVKGTTILFFNEKLSVQKTLRKPLEQLASFSKGNKVFVKKFIDSIKTTDTKLNGRINDQTILLKVTK